MKKLVLLTFLIISMIIMFSCEEKETEISGNDLQIDEFVESKDFNDLYLNNDRIPKLGIVDINRSFVEQISIEGRIHYIVNLAVTLNDEIVGQIIGFRVGNSEKLKSGDDYVIAYRDLLEFNPRTKTGIVRDYDLNYDSYLCGVISVEDNMISEIIPTQMPEQIKQKYAFNASYDLSKSSHPCDYSGEGDISFGECYLCLKRAIGSDGVTKFLCDGLDFAFLCSGSVTAACILIASTR